MDTVEDSKTKKSKGCAEEEESKITEQHCNRHSNSSQSNQKESNENKIDKKNKETSGCTSKDNSKASEVQKPDYIHVRARRGQATDSHSLAERVSKKLTKLQILNYNNKARSLKKCKHINFTRDKILR